MDNHHAEHSLQTLLYIARLSAFEDYGSAIKLGLRPDQIDAIRALSVQDLHELALSIQVHAITIQISPESVDTALRILKSRDDERELILAMIRAGAQFRMMNALFGFSNLCFSNYRKLLDLSNEGIGRPEILNDTDQKAIWSAWLKHEHLGEKERYLAVHQETHVPLRNIWLLIQDWETTGLTPILDEPSTRTT